MAHDPCRQARELFPGGDGSGVGGFGIKAEQRSACDVIKRHELLVFLFAADMKLLHGGQFGLKIDTQGLQALASLKRR